MADQRSFTVTPAQLDAIAALLKSHGITFDPTQPSGEAVQDKWDVSWTIALPTLTINLVAHPFAQAGFFWDKLEKILQPS
jgi:hypothetical protein